MWGFIHSDRCTHCRSIAEGLTATVQQADNKEKHLKRKSDRSALKLSPKMTNPFANDEDSYPSERRSSRNPFRKENSRGGPNPFAADNEEFSEKLDSWKQLEELRLKLVSVERENVLLRKQQDRSKEIANAKNEFLAGKEISSEDSLLLTIENLQAHVEAMEDERENFIRMIVSLESQVKTLESQNEAGNSKIEALETLFREMNEEAQQKGESVNINGKQPKTKTDTTERTVSDTESYDDMHDRVWGKSDFQPKSRNSSNSYRDTHDDVHDHVWDRSTGGGSTELYEEDAVDRIWDSSTKEKKEMKMNPRSSYEEAIGRHSSSSGKKKHSKMKVFPKTSVSPRSSYTYEETSDVVWGGSPSSSEHKKLSRSAISARSSYEAGLDRVRPVNAVDTKKQSKTSSSSKKSLRDSKSSSSGSRSKKGGSRTLSEKQFEI